MRKVYRGKCMKENKYEKCSLGWLREQTKKDGFDNIRDWQFWKRCQKNIKNIDQIKIYDKKKVTCKEREDFYRFWNKVDIKDNTEECWNWLCGKTSWGHGVACLNDGKGGIILSHRLAYILTKGDVPDELQVQHLCNNTTCCNPQHLELGTNSSNMKYMVEQGRSCIGEMHGNSKLKEEDVREIHMLYKGRGLGPTQADIAERFKISKREVCSILCGETWSHIYDEICKGE